VLDEKEVENFRTIVKDYSRGPHCNWCTFTYNEVESLLLTIDALKEELNKYKNVQ
jgi:hypothetical protein